MADWRLFIAVALPEAARQVLAAVQRELAGSGADVKWSRPENTHLTLKFLGDTPQAEVPDLSAALDEAARAGRPCVARLGHVGAFPDVRRPRVLWVGLDEPTGELVALQKRVEQATAYLADADPRGWAAHLTLGRMRSGRGVQRLSELLQGYRLASAVEIPVREVVLIRSVLSRAGPAYTPLHRAAIG